MPAFHIQNPDIFTTMLPDEKIRKIALISSMALFALSLTQKSYCTTSTCSDSIMVFLLGWAALFSGIEGIIWLANPFLFFAWVLLKKKHPCCHVFEFAGIYPFPVLSDARDHPRQRGRTPQSHCFPQSRLLAVERQHACHAPGQLCADVPAQSTHQSHGQDLEELVLNQKLSCSKTLFPGRCTREWKFLMH